LAVEERGTARHMKRNARPFLESLPPAPAVPTETWKRLLD
jgi:hypothetical protein